MAPAVTILDDANYETQAKHTLEQMKNVTEVNPEFMAMKHHPTDNIYAEEIV